MSKKFLTRVLHVKTSATIFYVFEKSLAADSAIRFGPLSEPINVVRGEYHCQDATVELRFPSDSYKFRFRTTEIEYAKSVSRRSGRWSVRYRLYTGFQTLLFFSGYGRSGSPRIDTGRCQGAQRRSHVGTCRNDGNATTLGAAAVRSDKVGAKRFAAISRKPPGVARLDGYKRLHNKLGHGHPCVHLAHTYTYKLRPRFAAETIRLRAFCTIVTRHVIAVVVA